MILLLLLLLLLPSTAYTDYDTEKILEIITHENPILQHLRTQTKDVEISLKGQVGNKSTGTDNDDDEYNYAGITVTIPIYSSADRKKRQIRYEEEEKKIYTQAMDYIEKIEMCDVKIASAEQEVHLLRDEITWAKKRVDTGIEEAKFLWTLIERQIYCMEKCELLLRERKIAIQKLAKMGGEKCHDILSLLGGKKKSLKS